jgi:hypothetical protein
MAAALRPSPRASVRVSFNEDSIKDTQAEMKQIRGAPGYIDNAAIAAGHYCSGIRKEQCAEKLRGAEDGTFQVLDGDDITSLKLVYVQGRVVREKLIVFADPGIRMQDSQVVFDTLTDLVVCYGGQNPEHPYMLRLESTEGQDDDEFGGAPADEERADVSPRDTQSSRRRSSKTYVMFEVVKDAPWFQAGLTRASANALIEFEPTGTFVVWDDQDNPGTFVLSYVKNGRLFHVNVEPNEEGYAIEGSTRFFKSMNELIRCVL